MRPHSTFGQVPQNQLCCDTQGKYPTLRGLSRLLDFEYRFLTISITAERVLVDPHFLTGYISAIAKNALKNLHSFDSNLRISPVCLSFSILDRSYFLVSQMMVPSFARTISLTSLAPTSGIAVQWAKSRSLMWILLIWGLPFLLINGRRWQNKGPSVCKIDDTLASLTAIGKVFSHGTSCLMSFRSATKTL